MPIKTWQVCQFETFVANQEYQIPEIYASYRKSNAPRFFFSFEDRVSLSEMLEKFDGEKGRVVKKADDILEGNFTYFSRERRTLGFPPDWSLNPDLLKSIPNNVHWSDISDFKYGDIKMVWELNRFSFVYDLVRAYWRTGDEKYTEGFWRLVEDWMEANPPNSGANWKCGQEIAFRTMACCFGLYGFLGSTYTTSARLRNLAIMIHESGVRISGHISYGLSQKNNHSISEALGLWTVGTLFPEFAEAKGWEAMGRQHLEQLATELIYEDGTFSQYSLNYHRVMLDDYSWVIRLAELAGKPFSSTLRERFLLATEFLVGIVDEETGQAPCFGQNDGACILPISNCSYGDYRQTVQLARLLAAGKRTYPSGDWDEALIWFTGRSFDSRPLLRYSGENRIGKHGGYYALKSKRTMAFTHCGIYRHRPAQADQLHTDIWFDGRAVALDAGTYSYNSPDPWNNSLAGTLCHNTVTVNGRNQMRQVSKFIWLPWTKGIVTHNFRKPLESEKARNEIEDLLYWQGGHDGYSILDRPVNYERSLLKVPGDIWIVLDRLSSMGQHEYRLQWLLMDEDYIYDSPGDIQFKSAGREICFRSGSSLFNSEENLVRADPHSNRGWCAPYYNSKEPALSYERKVSGKNVFFWTCFSRSNVEVILEEGILTVSQARSSLKVVARLGAVEGPIVRELELVGEYRFHERF